MYVVGDTRVMRGNIAIGPGFISVFLDLSPRDPVVRMLMHVVCMYITLR